MHEFPELSRVIDTSELSDGPVERQIAADRLELENLTRRKGISMLVSLTAQFTISPQSDGSVKVAGRLKAELEQSCSLTLEPIRNYISEAVEVVYLEDSDQSILDPEIDLEPLRNGAFDVGETLVQILSVAIDPYPRRAGVILPNGLGIVRSSSSDGDSAGSHPFAKLERLRKKQS